MIFTRESGHCECKQDLPPLQPEPSAPSWMFCGSWCVRWRCAISSPVCCHFSPLPLLLHPQPPKIENKKSSGTYLSNLLFKWSDVWVCWATEFHRLSVVHSGIDARNNFSQSRKPANFAVMGFACTLLLKPTKSHTHTHTHTHTCAVMWPGAPQFRRALQNITQSAAWLCAAVGSVIKANDVFSIFMRLFIITNVLLETLRCSSPLSFAEEK